MCFSQILDLRRSKWVSAPLANLPVNRANGRVAQAVHISGSLLWWIKKRRAAKQPPLISMFRSALGQILLRISHSQRLCNRAPDNIFLLQAPFFWRHSIFSKILLKRTKACYHCIYSPLYRFNGSLVDVLIKRMQKIFTGNVVFQLFLCRCFFCFCIDFREQC